jgi:predicted dehydrogenase
VALHPAPRSRVLRYGVIGHGRHVQAQLLPALAQIPGVRVVAVAGRRLDAVRQTAARWGADVYTDDWRDLFEGDTVDAVVAAANPLVHEQVAAACLERGLSVFVEKPPARNTASLASLVTAERKEAGRCCAFVGLNFPFGASYRKLRETLGRHDELRSVDVRMVASSPRLLDGFEKMPESLLLDLGIHALDLALRELGEPVDVTGRLVDLGAGRIAFRILIRDDAGRLASVHVGNHSNRFEYRCELVALSGATAVLDQNNTLVLARVDQDHAGIARGETVRYEWPNRPGGYGRTSYSTELEAFHVAVRDGRPSPSPLANALATYLVIDEVLSQTRGEQPETLPLGRAT